MRHQGITPLHQLFNQEVTRKEFLGIAALSLLSALGFSSIIHFLTGRSPSHQLATASGTTAGTTRYGTRKYGV